MIRQGIRLPSTTVFISGVGDAEAVSEETCTGGAVTLSLAVAPGTKEQADRQSKKRGISLFIFSRVLIGKCLLLEGKVV